MLAKSAFRGSLYCGLLLICCGCVTEKQAAFEESARQNIRLVAVSQSMQEKRAGSIAQDCATLAKAGLVQMKGLPEAFQQSGKNGDSPAPTPMHGYVYILYTDANGGYLILTRPVSPDDGRYQFACLDGPCWKKLDPTPGSFFLPGYSANYNFEGNGWEKDLSSK